MTQYFLVIVDTCPLCHGSGAVKTSSFPGEIVCDQCQGIGTTEVRLELPGEEVALSFKEKSLTCGLVLWYN